jgi:hypothetical protein
MRAPFHPIIITFFILLTLLGNSVYGQKSAAPPIIKIAPSVHSYHFLNLSNNEVPENEPNGTVIGIFHYDKSANTSSEPHFILTDNAGGRFALNDSLLIIHNTSLIDYETRKKFNIAIRVISLDGESLEKSFTIHILNANEPPTSISLSDSIIAENSPSGTLIANITGSDPDSSDVLSFSIHDDKNHDFAVHNNSLVVSDSAHIDYEKTPYLYLVIRATDKMGATFDKSFSIRVLNQNDAPIGVNLTNTVIKENLPVGTFVGTLSSIDEDTSDTHDYDLLNNAGGAFALFGNSLVVADSSRLNYEADSTLTITVRSTDNKGLYVEQPITIHIRNINEAPDITGITDLQTDEDIPTDTLHFHISDPETPPRFLSLLATTLDTSLVADSNIVLGGSQNNRWLFIRSNHDSSGIADIYLHVSDGVNVSTKKFKLKVHPVNDFPVVVTNDGIKVDEGSSKVISKKNLDITDVDNTPGQLKFKVTELPEHGTVFIDTTHLKKDEWFTLSDIYKGRIRYIHDGSETTNDQFKFNISDGSGGRINKQYFDITINPVNDPPAITEIPDVTTLEDTPTQTIPFTINDAETPPTYLEVSSNSTNIKLLPDSNIVLGGLGKDRSITMTPAPNQYGSSIVTVIVSDGDAHKVDKFKLTVKPVDDAPVIVPITAQVTKEDIPAKVKFQVKDIDTDVSKLKTWASSSNEILVPKDAVHISGKKHKRELSISPTSDLSGYTNITLYCNDGDSTSKYTFSLNVTPVNDPPDVFALYTADTYVNIDTMAITFSWEKAIDKEHDPVSYILNIKGDNYDTTVTHITGNQYIFTNKTALKPNALYDWSVSATDGHDTTVCMLAKDFIAPKVPGAPNAFKMSPNYPNPFNPTTTIHYQVPITSNVILSIYDMLGRKVTELVHRHQQPGRYEVEWNAAGQASGVYIYQIVAVGDNGNKKFVDTRKMILVK